MCDADETESKKYIEGTNFCLLILTWPVACARHALRDGVPGAIVAAAFTAAGTGYLEVTAPSATASVAALLVPLGGECARPLEAASSLALNAAMAVAVALA